MATAAASGTTEAAELQRALAGRWSRLIDGHLDDLEVLTQRAPKPAVERLPESLRALAGEQSYELLVAFWDDGVRDLVARLDAELGPGTITAIRARTGPTGGRDYRD